MALALALLLPSSAVAQSTPRLEDGVTDLANVLDSTDEADLEAQLDQGHDATHVQLWTLFVDTTDGATATDYATQTADANSLGGDDALLVVAFDDRSYALWVSDALGISDDEIDAILVDGVEPALRNDDPSGAALAAPGRTRRDRHGRQQPADDQLRDPSANPTPTARRIRRRRHRFRRWLPDRPGGRAGRDRRRRHPHVLPRADGDPRTVDRQRRHGADRRHA